jgi:hypothetical protein
MSGMPFVKTDGGRANAGYKGLAGDCVCRAVTIASGLPYQDVYEVLANGNATQRRSKRCPKRRRSAAHGISIRRNWFNDYMAQLGFRWVPTMRVGQGCQVHLKAGELPMGRLVVQVSGHMAAVIDGVLHDNHDCSRQGTRCVYGYFIQEVAR